VCVVVAASSPKCHHLLIPLMGGRVTRTHKVDVITEKSFAFKKKINKLFRGKKKLKREFFDPKISEGIKCFNRRNDRVGVASYFSL